MFVICLLDGGRGEWRFTPRDIFTSLVEEIDLRAPGGGGGGYTNVFTSLVVEIDL